RRLEGATEGEGLLGLAARTRRQRIQGVAQHRLQLHLEAGGVGSRREQDLLSGGLEEDGEEQVLEGEVGVAARHRLAGGRVQDPFRRAGEHPQASSTVARSGKPASRARSWTVATLVSATS